MTRKEKIEAIAGWTFFGGMLVVCSMILSLPPTRKLENAFVMWFKGWK